MSETVTFLSDAHLGGSSPATEAAKERHLVEFLATHRSGDALYLLGDVFDFWFEDGRPPQPRHAAVLRAIEQATARGVTVSFMGGNHDHWTRTTGRPGYLEAALGARLLDDPALVTHQQRRLLLTHGDALDGTTGAYRIVRGVLRHPAAIAAFRRLPRAIALALADRTSAASRRRHDSALSARDADRLRAAALGALASGAYDAVVAGHVHVPEITRASAGVYVNLGDWIEHRTYGRLVGGRLTLETFAPPDG